MRVIKQGLFQPGEEKAQEYSINIFKYLMVGNEDEGAKISSLVPSDWTKSNGYKKKKSEHKKALFVLWKWSNTKRLQRSCGVSTLGDIE